MSKKRVVVSLGHDALGYTTTEQWDAVKVTAKALADLIEEKAPQIRCLGPSDAVVAKVRDIYKKVIYCKHKDYEQLIEIKDRVAQTIQADAGFAKVMVWFDFDPMNQA